MNKGLKGEVWPAEGRTFQDAKSGVSVRQLTDYQAHNYHLYFTENGWYDGGKRLLFVSDRSNCTNLFSIELDMGRITQLTGLTEGCDFLSACLNPQGTKAYYKHRNTITEVDLATLAEKQLYEGPAGFQAGQISVSADGAYVLTNLVEDLSHRIRTDLHSGYVGHREIMEARPLSRIVQIPVSGGEARTVVEERDWIGHVNPSPVHPHLLTYCHEGPWQLVDQRIWGCDAATGRTWPIRPRREELEMVGHEYWLESDEQSGGRIGYHGFRANGTGFFGSISLDNTDMEETEFAFVNWHAHGDGDRQVIVDGRAPVQDLIYWRRGVDGFAQAKLLAEHRCSFHVQKVHAHPRFSPDGSKLLFTSDRSGYANLYLLDIPEDLDRLPDYAAEVRLHIP
ncbi:oligogalacturonate lyase family protein [Paenibacillus thalictri]|uniref:Oligogalacturonide lyase n=1 Tax=Paenibacillus thalictri TaxID=2527873 RepID=A0A4Q9DI68_9BACL|nr:oligogalacturonate lyase family protein [Paenibacillus thalictri]TBL70776.1 oligogalacturonide lyase [Paenibacillus thalictri]